MKDLVLKKIGAKWCGPCVALEKKQTLQKFVAKHPDVKLEIHDDRASGGSPVWEQLADTLNVRNLPTLVWTDRNGAVLLKSEDVSAAGIEAQYQKAVRKLR